MRVNVFAPFPPLRSGIAIYSEDLATAMQRAGVDVRRVNPSFWRTWRFEVPVRERSRTVRGLERLRTLALAAAYPEPFSDEDTVNHFHVSGNLFTYFLLRHFDRVRGRRVITVHDRHFVTLNRRTPVNEPDQLRMLRDCDLVLVHTEELRSALGFVNRNVEIVPHGVDLQRFDLDQAAAKARLGLSGPVISHLGFVFNHKGIEILLKAAMRLDATVLIVGSGPFEGEIRRLAGILCPGKTVLRPYASDEDYARSVAASDVVVLPRWSTQGECSGVMVQSMAAGRAIVAHDMGCFREYLGPDRGVLTTPGNITEFTEALESLLKSPELRARYGAASLAFARDNLAWDRVAEQHSALFAACLAPTGT